jgi:signal transduction histidine kinase
VTPVRSLFRPGRIRLTLRLRLTALYGAAFFAAGIVLVAVMYGLVAWNLDHPRTLALPIDAPVPDVPDSEVVFAPGGPVVERFEQVQKELRDATLSALLRQSLVVLAAAGVLALGLGYLLAGRALRPLHQITETARRVADDRSLHERIALDGAEDEIKELADTFDAMLARLDSAFAGQRRFAANASHELRTPLAVNRTLLEVAMTDPDASDDLRKLGRTLLATNDRSERLIEGLLLLSRSESDLEENKPVDLADLTGHVVDQMSGAAQESGLRITAALAAAPTRGDGLMLERVASNLVHNAVHHNRPGGEVDVRTGTGPAGAFLEVSNTGPDIRSYEVDALFEPFRRLRSERVGSDGGVGLGLSIVRSIIRAHGGTVSATPREGGGLCVRVTLPPASPATR